MGSSPTPWPSGSIQCIPIVRDGSAVCASLHVLYMTFFVANWFVSLFLVARSSSSSLRTFSSKIPCWLIQFEQVFQWNWSEKLFSKKETCMLPIFLLHKLFQSSHFAFQVDFKRILGKGWRNMQLRKMVKLFSILYYVVGCQLLELILNFPQRWTVIRSWASRPFRCANE